MVLVVGFIALLDNLHSRVLVLFDCGHTEIMSIVESLHYYDSNRLEGLSFQRLYQGWIHLNNKIRYVEMVIESGGAAPDLHSDLRKYHECEAKMTELLEARSKKNQPVI